MVKPEYTQYYKLPDLPERDGTPERDVLIAEVEEERKHLSFCWCLCELFGEDEPDAESAGDEK